MAERGTYLSPQCGLVFRNYLENRARYQGIGNYNDAGFASMEASLPLGVAAVRSTVMVLCFLLALLLDREKDLSGALFLAAFLILLFNPAALFDISFQLSFLSVAAMLYFIPRIREFFAPLMTWARKTRWEMQPAWGRKLMFYLAGSLLASLAAILGTGPLVGYTFNRISLVGFLANLVLVPLMGFVGTLLSLGLFTWLILRLDWRVVWFQLAEISWWAILLASASYLLSQAFNTLRWCILLWTHDVKITFWQAFRITPETLTAWQGIL